MSSENLGDWEPINGEGVEWFLWEPDAELPTQRWYQILLEDGSVASALFQGRRWWCVGRGEVIPILWRDAPYMRERGSL